MARVSACVITKNEENCISRCLQSVKDIVDEIIVVDTGSVDATVSIAQQMGAKVFYFEWCNDFSAARNYALAQAKGDWIIFLDADEYIADSRIKNVRLIIKRIHGNRKIDAIRCMLINLAGFNGSFRDFNPTIRIFRNSKAIRYEGIVHEFISKRGKKGISVINVDEETITVYHTGYTNEAMDNKIRRNLLLLEEEVKRSIVREFTYCYLSDSYFHNGEYEKAIEFAYKAINHMGQINRDLDYKPYVILIKSVTQLKGYNEEAAALICEEAIEKFPHHPEIWLHCGFYYRTIGRFEKALTSLLKAVAANACYNDFSRSNSFYISSLRAYLNIAQLYEMKNQSAQAIDYYVKALQREKLDEAAFKELIFLIREQESADILYLLNSLYNIAEEEDIRFLVGNLSRLKVKKVLGYYHQILLHKFHYKTLNGLVLLDKYTFEQVFPIFVDSFIKHGQYDMELLAVISLLINRRPDLTDLLGSQLHPAFRKILSGFFQSANDSYLATDDFSHFCDLVKEMAYMGCDEQVGTLLKMGKSCLTVDKLAEFGDMLLGHSFFRCALDIYLCIINKQDFEQLKYVYFKAGCCCYKLKKFAGTANYFAQALACGYHEHSIFEFLTWAYQQCSDAVIKEKIKMLQEVYSKQ